jgi:ABC-type multidrug transport system, ATPase and permease components
MKKYIDRRNFGFAVLFSIIVGLEMPFNTITYSYIFYLISQKSIKLIVPAISLILLGYLVFSVLKYVKNVVVNRSVYEINSKLKQTFLLSKMMTVTADENDFESKNLSFFLNDLKLLENNYWRQIFTMLDSAVMALGTLTYALYSNVYITLIFLAFMIIPTMAPRFFSKSIQTRTQTWSKTNKTLSGTVKNLLHGSLLLRRYHASLGFKKQLQVSINGMEDANAKMNNQISLSNSVISFLFDICSYLPIGIGIYFTISGTISLAQFVAIQYSSAWILNGFNSLITGWNTLGSTKEIRQNIIDLPVISEKTNSQAEKVNSLVAQDVSFSYGEKSIFKNVSFEITPGQKILIRGKSGVGKSTLFRMILGELKPNTGMMLLNKNSYDHQIAYNVFGIVGQTPIIFETSIKLNITLGDEKSSDEAVIKSLKQAGLTEYANAESLKLVISENGYNLSGGQLKRLEIARALYFDRQILLIDEGTASLDPVTAQAIHQSILQNSDLTVIEIDHHIPDALLKQYDMVWELTGDGLIGSKN